MDESIPPARGRGARFVAGTAFAIPALLVLYLAARPLDTSDLWFHLKAGEAYAQQGPWPAADPMLHTAHEDAPVQHEWLFGVAVHAVQRAADFHGLRVLHLLAAAGIVALAFSLFRRESPDPSATCLATTAFLVLAWWRLVQLRPDLFSIPAALLLHRLLLEEGRTPGRSQIAASVLLMVVWANVHSLFAIGPLLLGAALVGLWARARLAETRAEEPVLAAEARRRGRAVAAALGLGVVATLLNPRGIGQHLTFLTSSRETGIWAIRDEWSPFHPFAWSHYGPWVSFPAWLLTDLLLVLFPVAAVLAGLRFWRRPSAASLRSADPMLLALAGAATVALLVSVRFLWMAVFPLLFLLRSLAAALAQRREARPRARWALALGCAVLAVSFTSAGGLRAVERSVPRHLPSYLRLPYLNSNYHVAGTRFLQETGLEGHLFNAYTEGGFLGYWLAPRLRTFIDGRTEHYGKEVLDDYFAAVGQTGTRPGEGFLALLDRRSVDVFFGVGLPELRDGRVGSGLYTTSHLEGAPGWILVFRTIDQAVFLRANPRNRENLARVSGYYAAAGVPFDAERGLDVSAVLRARPDWAIAHQLAPVHYERLLEARTDADPAVRFRALHQLGIVYALVGAYEEGIAVDREAAALRPRAPGPLRRRVFGLLHRGRTREALEAARALVRLAPGPRSQAFEAAARTAAARAAGRWLTAQGPGTGAMPDRAVHQLPLLDPTEIRRVVEGRFAPVRMREARS